MSLIPQATVIAARIQEADSQTIGFLRAQAANTFDLVNTPGEQQAVMDAFGNRAVVAVATYAAIHAAIVLKSAIDQGHVAEVMGILQSIAPAIAALDITDSSPAPNLAVFVPQRDGTVKYVAPPEPEPELEPEPEPEPTLSEP